MFAFATECPPKRSFLPITAGKSLILFSLRLNLSSSWNETKQVINNKLLYYFPQLNDIRPLKHLCCHYNFTFWSRVHTKNSNHFSRTFQGFFKDHIRFSRTTYQEYNFTDCVKMHISSLPQALRLELFASPTSLHFSVHFSQIDS